MSKEQEPKASNARSLYIRGEEGTISRSKAFLEGVSLIAEELRVDLDDFLQSPAVVEALQNGRNGRERGECLTPLRKKIRRAPRREIPVSPRAAQAILEPLDSSLAQSRLVKYYVQEGGMGHLHFLKALKRAELTLSQKQVALLTKLVSSTRDYMWRLIRDKVKFLANGGKILAEPGRERDILSSYTVPGSHLQGWMERMEKEKAIVSQKVFGQDSSRALNIIGTVAFMRTEKLPSKSKFKPIVTTANILSLVGQKRIDEAERELKKVMRKHPVLFSDQDRKNFGLL